MCDQQITSLDLDHLAVTVLDQGAAFRFHAHGHSMSPFIKDGDIVTVVPVHDASSDIRIGDAVMARLNERRVVVHRVTRVTRDQQGLVYRLQGSANIKPDGDVPVQDILGRVISIRRGTRRRDVGNRWERYIVTLWTLVIPWVRRLYRFLIDPDHHRHSSDRTMR